MQIYRAEIKGFEDIHFGSGDDILEIKKGSAIPTTNDKTSEPAVLDPSVRLIDHNHVTKDK